jgi:hypothetical protein
MYSIRVDLDRNRLYVTLVGFFSLAEIKKCGDETIEATKHLRPGYDVITDITQFKAGTADVAADIERVQTHFRRSGARQGSAARCRAARQSPWNSARRGCSPA